MAAASETSTEASSGPTREELRRFFDDFDADGSGGISRSEFELITEQMGVRLEKEELDALMLEVTLARLPRPREHVLFCSPADAGR